jgi:hypothetical protein
MPTPLASKTPPGLSPGTPATKSHGYLQNGDVVFSGDAITFIGKITVVPWMKRSTAVT